MKKAFLITIFSIICVFAFTACGSKVNIDDVSKAFINAGYTASEPSSKTGTTNSLGATKGTTVVAVYEFNKESDADALVNLTNLGASVSKAKVSKKNKVFVCVAIDTANEANATAAITIFDNCF